MTTELSDQIDRTWTDRQADRQVMCHIQLQLPVLPAGGVCQCDETSTQSNKGINTSITIKWYFSVKPGLSQDEVRIKSGLNDDEVRIKSQLNQYQVRLK